VVMVVMVAMAVMEVMEAMTPMTTIIIGTRRILLPITVLKKMIIFVRMINVSQPKSNSRPLLPRHL